MIQAAGGNVASLPQSYAALQATHGASASWDSFPFEGSTISRDGQAMDFLIQAPSCLSYLLGQNGTDVSRAFNTVKAWRKQKMDEEIAKGVDAGSGWFWYLQGSTNTLKSVQS
jgi:hypothetical protein